LTTGNELEPEAVFSIAPDILFVYPFGGKSYEKFLSQGIGCVQVSEYLEKHPLGRAEWIRLFGCLLGKQALADRMFNEIESQYVILRDSIAKGIANRPVVFAGSMDGDRWAVPSANSYLATLFYDAGARYVFSDTSATGNLVLPFEIAAPVFDPVLILTMTLVMVVVMIESTGMFLALSDMTGKPINQDELTRGLRTDGLGTLIGGIFNTFPYTSFSQNVGLVAVTGVKSRWVCVAGGAILILLGLLPKMAMLIESLPTVVLGGAGLVMFGMVAATGIRILSTVDFIRNRNNAMIVAVSIGVGMIPLVAPNFRQWMPHAIHPLIESGILLASIAAVLLNVFFNGARGDTQAVINAARQADAH
jgi:hypothetical protein